MPIRRTPIGRWVEEDAAGNLSLIGDDLIEALGKVADSHYVHITWVDSPAGGHFHITIGYGHDTDSGEAEWGNDPDFEKALRYALGHHYGDHSDPAIPTGADELITPTEARALLDDPATNGQRADFERAVLAQADQEDRAAVQLGDGVYFVPRQSEQQQQSPWHREFLYGPTDDWHLVCAECGRHLRAGEEAWVQDDEAGNGTFARCLSHGTPALVVTNDDPMMVLAAANDVTLTRVALPGETGRHTLYICEGECRCIFWPDEDSVPDDGPAIVYTDRFTMADDPCDTECGCHNFPRRNWSDELGRRITTRAEEQLVLCRYTNCPADGTEKRGAAVLCLEHAVAYDEFTQLANPAVAQIEQAMREARADG